LREYNFDNLDYIDAETANIERYLQSLEVGKDDEISEPKLPFLRWLISNMALKNDSALIRLSNYVRRMMMITVGNGMQYRFGRLNQGFYDSLENPEHLKDFEDFLNAMGIECKLVLKKIPDGQRELYFSHEQLVPFYHYEMAENVIRFFKQKYPKAEDCAPKMLTKQEIKTKTPAGVRELPIPDYVFEAILEERKTYEKNRRRRPKEFRDWNYICCSTYGNPRSKGFHQKYYKDLLKSLDLPDIHFHQLRNTYATILLKNSFNSKGVSHLLGHAKEIISVDVYGDTQEIIEDCLDVLEPFIEEVIPKERKDQYYDYSEVIEIDLILEEYFNAA